MVQCMAIGAAFYVYRRTQRASMQLKYNVYDNPYADANYLMPYKGAGNIDNTTGFFRDALDAEDLSLIHI
eukprot:378559-Pyramimonas_sp.AAC.1